ncbi:MAG TPA: hypothetical protein VK184_14065 [Nostocaceae cyanobacterium]|nr:hypothetical protein [Nostocaceae cyanobacterium]
MKTYLPIPVFILGLLLISGWLSRNYILANYYFMSFQNSQTNEVRCKRLLQVLNVSSRTNLNSIIQQTYPKNQYRIRRGTLLWNEYAIAELELTIQSVKSRLEWNRSTLEVVLLKKESNGNFQVIYSCGKFLG